MGEQKLDCRPFAELEFNLIVNFETFLLNCIKILAFSLVVISIPIDIDGPFVLSAFISHLIRPVERRVISF